MVGQAWQLSWILRARRCEFVCDCLSEKGRDILRSTSEHLKQWNFENRNQYHMPQDLKSYGTFWDFSNFTSMVVRHAKCHNFLLA
jgi:hypothetical protein